MFSPTVSAPLTCSPGRSRGSKRVVLLDQRLGLHLEGRLVVGGPPVVEVAGAVVLRALVVEAVADLVADDRADAAVVLGRVGVGAEERLLQDAGREADLVGAGVVVGVDGLRQHEPLVAVDRRADLGQLAVGLERATRPRRCRAGRRGGPAARSSRGTSRGSRSWGGTCRASRRPAAWSPRSSSPARRSSRGRPRAGWRPGRPSCALERGGKCRATYSLPTASPIAPSTSATPRFQRARSSGVPLRVRP